MAAARGANSRHFYRQRISEASLRQSTCPSNGFRDRMEALKFLEWGHALIEKVGQLFQDMLKFLESEHVLIEKAGQLFGDMLWQAAL
jgi:hypothetical protein